MNYLGVGHNDRDVKNVPFAFGFEKNILKSYFWRLQVFLLLLCSFIFLQDILNWEE